ncbi:protein MAIN-LIKE 1-like [Papaver somniferum]|uniref:protein MAIN-LIKE 1-like n=1 Tax=Papaver somniferum TaxID=3469 RepID=UPI000E6FE164|nr:protein MAIN-LIKE 1-like [Papaver somniferum]
MKPKKNLGKSSSNQPPPEAEKPTSSNDVESEDQEEVNEGDAPDAETHDMTTIRAKEKTKKRSQEVTPCSDPTPQPRHTKPLVANARNASGVVTDGESEGGGNGVGAETAKGSEGVLVVTGGTEKMYDVVTVCGFRERFWPETMTFLLQFGEMTMTPDDAKKITGLALEGKVVFEGFNNSLPFDEIYVLAKDCVGLGKYEAEEEFEIGYGAAPRAKRPFSLPGEYRETINMSRKINLVRLREKLEEYNRKTASGEIVMDAERARHTAIAYSLHSLGTVFFPDFSRNKVNACYLQWLKTLSIDPETNEVPKYSWAIALLASVMESLCKASRWNETQITGCVSLIQSWDYDHFKCLRPSWDTKWPLEKPTGGRYPFGGTQHKAQETEMVEMRKKLDALIIDDVVFDPYLKLDEESQEEVGDK